MSAPIVSVIMPAYNGASLIGETLASLQAQTMPNFEIIAIEDCSTDDTLAVLRAWPDPRLKVIVALENGGPVRARNRAVAEARGRYIAALDQDDLCRSERFARQVAYLDTHPDTVVLGSASAVLDNGLVGPSSHAPLTTPRLIEWLLQIENPIVWSSVMLRGDVARRLDPFTRPEMLYAEDFDLYHRMNAQGGIARLDEELLVYRLHAGQASQRNTTTMQASAARVLTETHAAAFGDAAETMATLLVTHVMGRAPVPDRATLKALGETLGTLQAHFLANHDCDQEDIRLIRWETARRWARIGRASLRSGAIGLADAISVRPDHLGLGYEGVDSLTLSRLIGSSRGFRGQPSR